MPTQQSHTLPSHTSRLANQSLSKSVPGQPGKERRKSNKNLSLPDKKEGQSGSNKHWGRAATKIQQCIKNIGQTVV